MFQPEIILSVEEEEIIFRIRQLTGDTKEVFVDNVVTNSSLCSNIISSNLYELQEPLGYPLEISVDNIQYTTTSGEFGVEVLGYKYLKFTASSGVLHDSSSLLVIYNHFRNSDINILNTYDTSAFTYLTSQCNLDVDDVGVDLLILGTAYVLLTKDMSKYIKDGIKVADSDSSIDLTARASNLSRFLDYTAKSLKEAIEVKTRCKMLRLPVYKVE